MNTAPKHGITPDQLGGEVTQAHIDQAVATITELCGWQPWPERRETFTVRAPGDTVVFLPTKHLVNVHTVTIDGKDIDLDKVDWWEDGLLELQHRRRKPFRLTADVTHGTEPGPLLGLVSAMAGRAARPPEGYSVGRVSVSAPGALTPQSTEWRLIDQYKLGPMP